MDVDFWLNKWKSNQIGFHEDDFHPMLCRHWDALGVDRAATVFVPLCGKSRDMHWLRERGHPIVGIELSEIAVRDFFEEAGIPAETDQCGPFTRTTGGGYTLLCGDIFKLTTDTLGPFAAVYDRASLIALPPDVRADYAGRLRELSGTGVQSLLITVQYPADMITPPPFEVPDAVVEALFSPWCDIDLLGHAPTEVKGVAASESVFMLRVR